MLAAFVSMMTSVSWRGVVCRHRNGISDEEAYNRQPINNQIVNNFVEASSHKPGRRFSGAIKR